MHDGTSRSPLSVDERIDYLQLLWDQIAATREVIPVPGFAPPSLVSVPLSTVSLPSSTAVPGKTLRLRVSAARIMPARP